MCQRDFHEESLKLAQAASLEERIARLVDQMKVPGTHPPQKDYDLLNDLSKQYKALTGAHYQTKKQ